MSQSELFDSRLREPFLVASPQPFYGFGHEIEEQYLNDARYQEHSSRRAVYNYEDSPRRRREKKSLCCCNPLILFFAQVLALSIIFVAKDFIFESYELYIA